MLPLSADQDLIAELLVPVHAQRARAVAVPDAGVSPPMRCVSLFP